MSQTSSDDLAKVSSPTPRLPSGSTTSSRRSSFVTCENCGNSQSISSGSCNCAGEAKYVQAVIAMVGLPASGKTFISKKLARYLNWIGIETKAFNLGEYRRSVSNYTDHKFFDPTNQDAKKQREMFAREAMNDAVKYLHEEGQVAVIDATNTTRERRQIIIDLFSKEKGFDLFFVESVCDDPSIVDDTIRKVKVNNSDYTLMQRNDAINDFKMRIEHYRQQYASLDLHLDSDISFIQNFNEGERFIVNKMVGALHSKVVYYLMNIHSAPRTIYLTRHGESEMNIQGRIGGDEKISENGIQYAIKLAEFIHSENIPDLKTWTSGKKRTIQTANYMRTPKQHFSSLNEINAGICEGMTYHEIQEKFPLEFNARNKNKFHYRYPHGESYKDLVERLEPVIMELERQTNVLVICHQAVLRCLLAYFQDNRYETIPYIDTPLHTVFKLKPEAYGCNVEMVNIEVPAVETSPIQSVKTSPKQSIDLDGNGINIEQDNKLKGVLVITQITDCSSGVHHRKKY